MAIFDMFLGFIVAVLSFFLKPILAIFKDKHDCPYAVPGRQPPDPAVFPFYMQNKQNMWLYWRQWLPTNLSTASREPLSRSIKGVVFLVGGLGEHNARYDGSAVYLNERGYACFFLDHQGQGNSEGERQYVTKFTDFVDDMEQFIKHVFVVHPELARHPRFILGHSMGGLIATHVSMRDPKSWNGVLLSGPALEGDPKIATPFLKTVAGILGKFAPKLGIDKLKISDINRNRQVVELAYQDPTYPKQMLNARWASEMLMGMNYVFDHVKEKEKTGYNALLVIHGEKDALCYIGGSKKFVDLAKCEDKKFIEYPGRFHELLTDTQRQPILDDVLKFFDTNLRH